MRPTYEELEKRVRELEKQLDKETRNIRYILKHNPNAIAVYDKDLYYLMVSDRYLTDYNVKENNIIGKHHYEVFPEIPKRWREIHQRALKGEVLRNDDDYFYREDGSITYNRWECRPWYDLDGKIAGMITYTEVITERKEAELALKESEERYRNIVETSPDGIVTLNKAGKIISVNKSFLILSGYKERDFVGKYFLKAPTLVKQNLKFYSEIVSQLFKGNTYETIEFKWKHANGEIRLAEAKTGLLKQKGKIVGLQVIVRDITNQKELEKKLIENNTTKDRLFSILGHDLKTPLNNVIGFAKMMNIRIKEIPDGKIQKYNNMILHSAESLHLLLENMTNWIRTQKEKIHVIPAKIELNSICEECLELLKVSAEKKQVSLTNNIPPHLKVEGDRQMIATIIRNLVSNSVKFTNRGGLITTDARSKQGKIIVSVEDNGIGMGKDELRKLFHLKDKHEVTGTEGEKGTGLGLIICKEFIELNNGEIWAESKKGKGSVFYFSLPQAGIA